MSLAVSTLPQTTAVINKHSWLLIHSGHQNVMNEHVEKSTPLFPMGVNEKTTPVSEDGVANGHNTSCSSNVTNNGTSRSMQYSKPYALNGTNSCDKKRKKSVSDVRKERLSPKNTGNLDSSGLNHSSTSIISNESGKPMALGRIPRYVKCFTCERIIKEDHFSEHLLFGSVKCAKCNSLFMSCQSFQIWATEYALGNVLCNHDFFYIGDSVKYLKKKISSSQVDSPLENDKVVLIKNYINKLKSLEERPPWQQAIRECKIFIERHESSVLGSKININATSKDRFGITKRKKLNTSCSNYFEDDEEDDCTYNEEECLDNFQDYDLEQLEKATEFVKVAETYSNSGSPCPKFACKKEIETKKRKSKVDLGSVKHSHSGGESMEYVPIPSNGFYYVSTNPIEECPNCYEMLCPSRFTVNVATFLMTVVCLGCNLTIYITSPEVKIITDDDKITETLMADSRNYAVSHGDIQEKQKRGRGRPRKPESEKMKRKPESGKTTGKPESGKSFIKI